MNLGKVKIVVGRSRDYLSLVQFGMMCYLVFRDGVSDWWLVAIPVFGLFMWYDYRKILPSEYKAGMDLNPEWQRVMNDTV